MDLPDGFSRSHPAMADASAVLALVNGCEVADGGETMLELSDVQAGWATPDVDLQRNVTLIDQGAHLIAWVLDLYLGLGMIVEHTLVHRSKLLRAAP